MLTGALRVSSILEYDAGEPPTHANAISESSQSNPAAGVWWGDPDTNYQQVMRLHDFTTGAGYGHHVYSDMPAFSASMTYYAVVTNGGTNIYSWADRSLVRSNIQVGSTFFFSVSDDDAIIYFSGSLLRKYTISTGVKSTIHDFTDIFPDGLTSACMKRQSDDGRYMAIPGANEAAYGVVRYDFTLDSHSPATPITRGSETEVGVSPSGEWIILNTTYPKTYLPDGTLVGEIETLKAAPHYDVMQDGLGDQWFIFEEAGLYKVKLPSGNTPIQLLDNMGTSHISGTVFASNCCIISTYQGYSSSSNPFYNEIFRLYLDSTTAAPHIERLFHHRSRYWDVAHEVSDYWHQPHACISPDGDYALFSSSWMVDPVVGDPKTDPYVLDLHPASSNPFNFGWNELNDTDISSISIANNYLGKSYSFGDKIAELTEAWNGAIYDPSRNWLIMGLGGHADYYSNAFYAISLANRTRFVLTEPCLDFTVGTESRTIGNPHASPCLLSGDPVPCSRHTFSKMVYLPTQDVLMMMSGSMAGDAGNDAKDAWWLDYSGYSGGDRLTPVWTEKQGVSPYLFKVQGAQYDPETECAWFIARYNESSNYSLVKYDPSDNSLARYRNDGLAWNGDQNACLDTLRHRLVFIGNNTSGNNVRTLNLDDPYASASEATSGECGTVCTDDSPGITYDSIADLYCVWNGGDTVYTLNPTTWAWGALALNGSGPSAMVSGHGTHGRFCYVSTYGGFVAYGRVAENCFFARVR